MDINWVSTQRETTRIMTQNESILWDNKSTTESSMEFIPPMNDCTKDMTNSLEIIPALASLLEANNRTKTPNGPKNASKTANLIENRRSSSNKRMPRTWQSTWQSNDLPNDNSYALSKTLMGIDSSHIIQGGPANEVIVGGLAESPHSSSTEQSNPDRMLLNIQKPRIDPPRKKRGCSSRSVLPSFADSKDCEFYDKLANENKRNIRNRKQSSNKSLTKTKVGLNSLLTPKVECNNKIVEDETGNSLVNFKTSSKETFLMPTTAVETVNQTEAIINTDENESKRFILFKSLQKLKFQSDIIASIDVWTTKLEIKVINWDFTNEINEPCLRAISELKNLEELRISAKMLHYDDVNIENRFDLFSKIKEDENLIYSYETCAFVLITENCKRLKKLYITDDTFPINKIIPEYLLFLITKFSQLEVLELKNIPTCGKGISLPSITEACKQLKCLQLENVCNLQMKVDGFSIEKCLQYLKNCNEFCFSFKVKFSKKIITNICECFRLNSLILDNIDLKNDEAEYFANNLPQLKYLRNFSLRFNGTDNSFEALRSALRSMREKKPSFVINLANDNQLFTTQICN